MQKVSHHIFVAFLPVQLSFQSLQEHHSSEIQIAMCMHLILEISRGGQGIIVCQV